MIAHGITHGKITWLWPQANVMITARRKEHQIMRNCFHFKLVTGSSNAEISDNESQETDEDTII